MRFQFIPKIWILTMSKLSFPYIFVCDLALDLRNHFLKFKSIALIRMISSKRLTYVEGSFLFFASILLRLCVMNEFVLCTWSLNYSSTAGWADRQFYWIFMLMALPFPPGGCFNSYPHKNDHPMNGFLLHLLEFLDCWTANRLVLLSVSLRPLPAPSSSSLYWLNEPIDSNKSTTYHTFLITWFCYVFNKKAF